MAAIFASASVTLLTMTSCANFEFGIDAFDSCIHVECANSEIRDALERYLFPPVPRRKPTPSSPDIHLRVDKVAQGFRVLLNHETVALALTLHDAVLAAVKTLDDAVVHRMKVFRAVHAGAVLIGERALVLPAPHMLGSLRLLRNCSVEAHPASRMNTLSLTTRAASIPTHVHFCSAMVVPCSRLSFLRSLTRVSRRVRRL